MRTISPVQYICRSCFPSLLSLSTASTPRLNGGQRRFTSSIRDSDRSSPYRLAIVGSGPAAFYTAASFLRAHNDAVVDMYERLPVPFGLVRYGVAPDHPEVKNCQDRFTELARQPNFRFIGNVSIGGASPTDITVRQLLPHYHGILLAYGGAAEDRRLGIPGETLDGVLSAREFVSWYNGVPGASSLYPRLNEAEKVVIIGNGNVALDVARVLMSDVDRLRKTDMTEYAIEALSRSRVKSVHIVGRRGVLKASFTIKELRELVSLPNVLTLPIEPPTSLTKDELATLQRPRRRLTELLLKSPTINSASTQSDEGKRWLHFHFNHPPKSFQAHPLRPTKLHSINFTTLPRGDISVAQAEELASSLPTVSPIAADLAFRAIGYLPTIYQSLTEGLGVLIRNGLIQTDLAGRAQRLGTPHLDEQDGSGIDDVFTEIPGIYVAGWARHGPVGVIARTLEDATVTGNEIARDARNGVVLDRAAHSVTNRPRMGFEGVKEDLSSLGRLTGRDGIRIVDWEGWERIDAEEKRRGANLRKEREKIVDIEEMLRIAGV